MPCGRDFERILKGLEDAQAGISRLDAVLEEVLAEGGRALEVYRKFRRDLKTPSFEVRTVAFDRSGQILEEAFDWRALDSAH